MLGKINLVAASILAFSASVAQAGFYVGAGLGPDAVDYKQKSHVFQPNTNQFDLIPATVQQINFDVIDKAHLSGTGLFGTIFAGFNGLNGRFYYAGEVNANLSSSSFRASNEEYVHSNFSSTHYKMNNSFGISALPGFQYTPTTLFYGRLGYQNTHFKTQTTDVSLANVSKHLNGFRYGVGIKQDLSEKVALRMDYSRIAYGDVKMATFDALSSTSKTTSIKPNQQLVEFALVYQFA